MPKDGDASVGFNVDDVTKANRQERLSAGKRATKTLIDAARLAIDWTLGAFFVWLLVLAVPLILRNDISAFPSAVRIAGIFALMWALPLAAAPHVLRCVLELRRRHYNQYVERLIIVIALAYPIYSFVSDLTSGDWVASQKWVSAFRLSVFVCAEALLLTVWQWHRTVSLSILDKNDRAIAPLATSRFSAPFVSLDRWLRSRFGWLNYLTAAFGLFVATTLIETRLSAYAAICYRSLPLLGFCGATLGFVLVRRLRNRWERAHDPSVALVAMAFVLIPIALDPVHGKSTRSALHLLTALATSPSDDTQMRIDFTGLKPSDCPAFDSVVERAAPNGKSECPRCSVILISIDALRADTLGRRVAGKKVTPNLDLFEKDAIRFTNANTTYPATLFGLGGALTGQSPSDILYSPKLPNNVFTLASQHGVESHVFLPDDRWFRMPVIETLFVQKAISRYFADSTAQTDAFIAHLETRRNGVQPMISWLHYYDPHPPFERHEGLDFGSGPEGGYLGEVAFADRELGRVMNYLRSSGWFDRSLVIVFSDHGQALGERGYYGHNVFLNRWVSNVALMVHERSLGSGTNHATASLADITPTLLEHLQLPASEVFEGVSLFEKQRKPKASYSVIAEAFTLRGQSLFDLTNQTRDSGLEVLKFRLGLMQRPVQNYSPKVSITSGASRLIVDRTNDAREFYDDTTDPSNATNLHGIGAELREKPLEMELLAWHKKKSLALYCRAIRHKP